MHESKARAIPGYLCPLSAAVLACLAPQLVQAQAASSADRPEEIIVTSSIIAQPRRQIGTAVSSIDFEEIELRGYTDVSEVLRTQTSLGVTNSGGAGKSTAVRIRGEETYRTTLIIDGVKAVDPAGAQVAPSFDSLLTTSDLQRVEVLRGPQGFMYGADAGGVVNVLTKRGADELGGQIGMEAGDYSTRKVDAALSGGSDQGDYYLSVADFATDGFNSRTSDTVLQDDDGADNTTLHAKLGWNATDSLRLQLVARDIDAEAQYDNCFGGPPAFALSQDCLSTTEQTTYKLSAEHTADELTNAFGYSEVDVARDDLTAGVSSFAREGKLSRLEYTGSYKPSGAFALVFGVDLQEEEASDGFTTQSRDQDGYYVEYQGAFNDAFFLSLGARYDDNEDFGSHTSSRLSVAYVQDLGSDRSVKYRGSVGTGFRAPSLFEIAYNERPFGVAPVAAATALTEEQSVGYDIGLEYSASNGLRFEITYFDQEITNQIDYISLGAPNFDDGYVQIPGVSDSTGIELGVDVPFGERWMLLANWTHNEAEDETGQQRPRRPKNFGNLGVQYRAANDRLSILANYRLSSDAIDITFPGTVPLPDYEVLDLSATFDATDLLQIYGRVQNLTDETYYEVAGYNTAERAVYGGVRLRF